MIMGIWKKSSLLSEFFFFLTQEAFYTSTHVNVPGMVPFTWLAYKLSDRKLSALSGSGYFSITLLLLRHPEMGPPPEVAHCPLPTSTSLQFVVIVKNHFQTQDGLISISGVKVVWRHSHCSTVHSSQEVLTFTSLTLFSVASSPQMSIEGRTDKENVYLHNWNIIQP